MKCLLSICFALFVMIGQAQAKLNVVASFSIIGDLVKTVGGESIDLSVIVGTNGDAHTYEPKPEDTVRLSRADVIFSNGLAFEGWLDRLVEASGTSAPVVALGTAAAGDKRDPHAWQDVRLVIKYVDVIADSLCAKDTSSCDRFRANAARYDAELRQLDADIRQSFSRIPPQRRVVITSHDAFGYFAETYDVRFLAPQGVNTSAEASAQDVAKLIQQIREVKASALLVESITDPRLLDQIARETGLETAGPLYADTLSDSSGPAPTYIDMMRHNAGVLAKAMQLSP